MKFAMSLMAVAGIAAAANAATSTMTWRFSVNGGSFVTQNAATPANPGDTVTFRLFVTGASLTGSGGLAGFNMLPTLSNWSPTNTANPLNAEQFPEGSVNNPFSGVIDHPDLGHITNVYTGGTVRGPGNVGGTGRNAPFGANGTNTTGVATSSVVGGSLQWTAGVINNTGVSIAQLNSNNSGITAVSGVDDAGTPGDTFDDTLLFSNLSFANNGRANLIVFSYSMVIGGGQGGTMTASHSVLGDTVQWFSSFAGASQNTTGSENVVNPAVLTVAPAPGALALLGLGGLVATRRRR